MTTAPPGGHGRYGAPPDFQDLMRYRIMDILMVASPYDLYVLEEGGQLGERMLGEYRNLDLHYSPGMTRVSSGAEALARLARHSRINLVVTTPHPPDMSATELAARARRLRPEVPVILLAYDKRELKDLTGRTDLQDIERAFLWQGDARILVAIVKYVEDKLNVAHDTDVAGVQVILVVEDNVRYYSSFLPVIYTELFHHSLRLLSASTNASERIFRFRARPKILLCRTFEEAWDSFEAYQEDVLGVISDVEFPWAGERRPGAGAELTEKVKALQPDVPVILHSSRPENADLARRVGAEFLQKGSPLLLRNLRRIMLGQFAFGDFVFRLPDGREVARAVDLRSLQKRLETVPAESIAFHAARNHFSRWLKARTEFAVAHELRPKRIEDFPSIEDLRQTLIQAIADYRRARAQTAVSDFDADRFDGSGDFYRIGGGSLGGKARGLAFARRLLAESRLARVFPGVEVAVPPSVVIGTDVFDRFLDDHDLRDFAVQCEDDAEVERRFLGAALPEETVRDLAAFARYTRHPVAVRSSSLLEDSPYQPFTGVYDTLMLANAEPDADARLDRLVQAIKRVYASTFSQHARAYLKATSYRMEEEKMAVIVQQLVGRRHGDRFYPSFSGVARSHNFYPTPPLTAADGIVAVALGLGRGVADGGDCVRFSPVHPRHVIQFSTVRSLLESSQRSFWALRLEADGADSMREESFGLDVAELDGTLGDVASTYSPENDAVYDGVSRAGQRVVTFAPILKQDEFPLARIVQEVLEAGSAGMGSPVEIEFAVNLAAPAGEPRQFAFLQMRPMAPLRESEGIDLGETTTERVLCHSTKVLGNGRLEGLRDIVVVDFKGFERSRSREAAQEVGRVNARLVAEGQPYLLIGVGRWGSRDPWLGIPVTWDQVAGAAAIVEAGLRDIQVAPSQGTHFFQNLTSFNVGYFTVNPELGDGTLDWEWLERLPACSEAHHVRHVRIVEPLIVKMDGRHQEGVILKPEAAAEPTTPAGAAAAPR